MKKHFHIALLLSCFAVLTPNVAHAQESTSTTLGIVTSPLANVHEEPLPKSKLVTQVLMGDEVRIQEKKDNHYRVTILNQGNNEGWIQQEAVQILKDKGRTYLNANRQWIVVTTPKTEALILDKTGNHKVPLYAGTHLPVLQQNTVSFKVQFPDRSVAIIDAADVMPVKSGDPLVNDTKPEDIATTAKRFQGVRYLAGGMTAQGIDTSGLIYISYRIHGLPISRDRGPLKEKAERVSKKELEAGDILIFYGERQGLYVGNGRFLQVTKKSTVQAAGIYDRRFTNSLQYGLRLIGADPNESKNIASMTADEILLAQERVANLPVGKRIAYWAGRFIGIPYDPDPLGLYVRTKRIVADEKADCMYHAFRSVELAESTTPREAIDKALSLRFIRQGKLTDGLITNYDERFQYGEDMVTSGKWGKNITAELGATKTIPGSRGKDTVDILPRNVLLTRTLQKNLRDGDIVYWVKDPKKRVVEEIVSHLSIIHIKSDKLYLIHAAGDKDRDDRPGGGVVKEVPFSDYVRHMKFIGAFVTRIEM
ncbi:MAG TPA: NlpC/P60 family protein [Nitrospirota bacterium]|nr:NlpC/P60 family protein [Nitrospirota bacterium]